MEGGKAGEVGGSVIMMDTASLDTVRGTIMSNHRDKQVEVGWDNTVSVGLKMGLE